MRENSHTQVDDYNGEFHVANKNKLSTHERTCKYILRRKLPPAKR